MTTTRTPTARIAESGGTFPDAEPADRIGSIHWLSAYLDVPVMTIREWRKRSYGPPAMKLGGHLRWRQRDVDAWLVERRENQHD